ncbi:unnamed protein product [Heterobilharzia americana]|nr:unnamed protein product [Heterobilharzia americana]
MEKESNNQLPFLDVLASRTNIGKLETQVYRKPTHTDQILNYNSNNTQNQLRADSIQRSENTLQHNNTEKRRTLLDIHPKEERLPTKLYHQLQSHRQKSINASSHHT